MAKRKFTEFRNPDDHNGIHAAWSIVNQAWFLMWFGEVLRVFTDADDLQYELDRILS